MHMNILDTVHIQLSNILLEYYFIVFDICLQRCIKVNIFDPHYVLTWKRRCDPHRRQYIKFFINMRIIINVVIYVFLLMW